MKNFSNISEMSLLCLEDESIDFTIEDVNIDRASLTIKQYILAGATQYQYYALPQAFASIGDMRVITAKREYIAKIPDADILVLPVNMPVVSLTGDNIGIIIDFCFDEATGRLDRLYINSGHDEISVSADAITFFTEVAVLKTTALSDYRDVFNPEIAVPLPYIQDDVPAVEAEALDDKYIENEVNTLPIEDDVEIEETPIFESPAELVDGFTVAEAAHQERSALEQESISFLLGKVINHNITSDDGKFTLKAGTVLTEDIIDEAEAHDAILTLTLSV